MSSPINSNILLPSDAGNTGKKVRTQTRVINGDTVHEHFFVLTRRESVLNVFRFAQDQNTVLAGNQNGTTAGMLFGHMPTSASGKAARLRRLAVSSQHSTALATPSAPRLRVARFTASGALSGGLLAPAANDSAKPAAAFLLSAVNTPLTVTLGAGFGVATMVGALTAVGAYDSCIDEIIDSAAEEDDWPVFYPGEGFVVYQDTIGTAADTRKFNLVVEWDEIET